MRNISHEAYLHAHALNRVLILKVLLLTVKNLHYPGGQEPGIQINIKHYPTLKTCGA